MGEAVEKLSGKLGVDTTDFKTNIAAANRELRLLETGFKANTAALGDWSSSATGLESRISTLTSKIEVQTLKVAALRENFERIKSEQGENSRAAKEAEISLNKETETLGKMQSELSTSEQALQELKSAEDDAGSSADEAGGKVKGLGSSIDIMGGVVKGSIAVVSGLAAAVGAVGAAIGGLVLSTANTSAELVDLSTQTGITTTRLQEMQYIGEQVGTSQETFTGSMARLIRTMDSAQEQFADYNAKQAEASDNFLELKEAQIKAEKAATAYNDAIKKYGDNSIEAREAALAHLKAQENLKEVMAGSDIELGETASAFERLGISITDANGNLRDNEAVFADVIDALGKIPNEAERDALAMSIFGKSAQELNPLIKAGTEEMKRLAEEAHNVGAVMSEEDVAAFEAFDDTLASLQAGLKGTLGTLASAFLPGFQSLFDQAGGYLREFADIVKTSDGDFGALADGLGGLLTKIIGDIATQGPQMLEAGLGILQSVIDAIVTNLPVMIPAAIGIITNLLNFIVANLPTLISAGLQILIALVQGISQALPTLIPAIVQAIITIVQTIADNLPLLIDAALQLILALVQGLIIALPILIAALPQIIDAIVNALLQSFPLIMETAGQLVGMLAAGIVAAIPVLVVAALELIARLYDTIKNFVDEAPYHGKNFVHGLGEGIKNATGFLYDAVSNLISGMLEKIKSLLNMHSPSGVGKDIGGNLFESIGLGGEEQAPKMRRMLTRQMLGLANDLSGVTAPAGRAGPGSVGGVSAATITFGDIIIQIQGTTAAPKDVAVAARDGVLAALRAKGVS